MSAQFKLDQEPRPNKDDHTSLDLNKKKRPNIDHLLKRISLERKKEKRSILTVIVLAVLGISVVSVVFTQA